MMNKTMCSRVIRKFDDGKLDKESMVYGDMK